MKYLKAYQSFYVAVQTDTDIMHQFAGNGDGRFHNPIDPKVDEFGWRVAGINFVFWYAQNPQQQSTYEVYGRDELPLPDFSSHFQGVLRDAFRNIDKNVV